MDGQYIVSHPDRPHLVLFAASSLEEVASALAAQPQAQELMVSLNQDGFSRALDTDEASNLGALLDVPAVGLASPGMTTDPYVPQGNARFAYLNLYDPLSPDSQGWIMASDIESQRGRWAGSDDADFLAGLAELIENGWAERDGDAYRLTARGAMLKTRMGLG
jgi:hypothetical protein